MSTNSNDGSHKSKLCHKFWFLFKFYYNHSCCSRRYTPYNDFVKWPYNLCGSLVVKDLIHTNVYLSQFWAQITFFI